MKKMMLVERTEIQRRWLNKGEVVTVSDAVASRLIAHKLAKPYVEPKGFTLADVEAWRADGMTLKDAKKKAGVRANSWKELLAKAA